MNPDFADQSSSTVRQLRPIVMAVIAANLAVFSLLMTTINLPSPHHDPIAIADVD
ncbi:hypothetical protein [Xaviernesmea oryzae]|uniref:hypothetical protein n=1 Tax=Xaviernesmea oryzae TaxID=464029 RepID=UPI0008D19B6A|nr:hypothetical protein [Xaviernesmea oryzae]SEL62543.1 hypothetical protein SAMN04487976_110141 [Xaviernesmea oryzae]